mgnify:CR=1 FL=1
MAELKCSIYKCTQSDCDIIGGTCDLCGEWPLCQKHMHHTNHKRCQNKYYFAIPYAKKSEAKTLGLFYDLEFKKWYANNKKSYDQAMEHFMPIEI